MAWIFWFFLSNHATVACFLSSLNRGFLNFFWLTECWLPFSASEWRGWFIPLEWAPNAGLLSQVVNDSDVIIPFFDENIKSTCVFTLWNTGFFNFFGDHLMLACFLSVWMTGFISFFLDHHLLLAWCGNAASVSPVKSHGPDLILVWAS